MMVETGAATGALASTKSPAAAAAAAGHQRTSVIYSRQVS